MNDLIRSPSFCSACFQPMGADVETKTKLCPAHHVTSDLRSHWSKRLSVKAGGVFRRDWVSAVLRGQTAAEGKCLQCLTGRSWSGAPAAFAWCRKTAPLTARFPWTSRSGSRIKRWDRRGGFVWQRGASSDKLATIGSVAVPVQIFKINPPFANCFRDILELKKALKISSRHKILCWKQ